MKRLSRAVQWVVGWLVHLRRIVWFWKAAFVRSAVLTGNDSREKCVLGVVLSGGDFTPGGAYPGNYGYPPNASIDYYASKGMGVIRLPFLWERVQPVKNGPLDATEMSRIGPVVDYALSRDLKVGLDVHNGGYGYGKLIGGPDTSDADFADLWGGAGDALQGQARRAVHAHEPAQRTERAAVAEISQRGHRGDPAPAVPRRRSSCRALLRRCVDVDGHGQCRCGRLRRRRPAEQLHVRGPPVSRPGQQRRKRLYCLANHRRGQAGGRYGVGTRPRQEVLSGEFGTGADAASLAALDTMLAYIQHNCVWPMRRGGAPGTGGMTTSCRSDPPTTRRKSHRWRCSPDTWRASRSVDPERLPAAARLTSRCALIREAGEGRAASYFQLSLIMSAIAFFRNIGGEATWIARCCEAPVCRHPAC